MAKAAEHKEMVNIEEELRKEVQAINTRIGAPARSLISLRDKVFTFPDGRIHQGPLELVILDFVSQNLFYEGRWDPKKVEAPACFAIGDSPMDLVPSKNSPKKQAENCADCPLNQFGSSGTGKACKNARLLAVSLPADPKEIYTIRIPPTGLKTFDAYVGGLSKLLNKAPIQVVTTVSFHPEKTYALPIFGNPKPNEHIEVFFAERKEARALLEREPLFVPAD